MGARAYVEGFHLKTDRRQRERKNLRTKDNIQSNAPKDLPLPVMSQYLRFPESSKMTSLAEGQ